MITLADWGHYWAAVPIGGVVDEGARKFALYAEAARHVATHDGLAVVEVGDVHAMAVTCSPPRHRPATDGQPSICDLGFELLAPSGRAIEGQVALAQVAGAWRMMQVTRDGLLAFIGIVDPADIGLALALIEFEAVATIEGR